VGIIGPFPEHMMKSGRLSSNFFTKEKLLYQEVNVILRRKFLSE